MALAELGAATMVPGDSCAHLGDVDGEGVGRGRMIEVVAGKAGRMQAAAQQVHWPREGESSLTLWFELQGEDMAVSWNYGSTAATTGGGSSVAFSYYL
ncbi:hypothetical protein SESBI_10310, partial [Sesbania bispinosa]